MALGNFCNRASLQSAVISCLLFASGCNADTHPVVSSPVQDRQAIPLKLRRPIDSFEQCLSESALRGADIVWLAQYGGAGPAMPYDLRGALHGTRLVTIDGDPGRPVVLVLSAYEPTVWDLSRLPRGRIRAVVASGFYAQGIIGVANKTPVAMTHRAAGNAVDPYASSSSCPIIDFSYAGSKARTAAQAIRISLGRYPVEFFGAYAAPYVNLSRDGVPGRNLGYDGILVAEDPPSILQGSRTEGRRITPQAPAVFHHVRWRDNGALISESAGPDAREDWAIGALPAISDKD